MNLEAMIEAVLFYKTEPITVSALAEFFDVSLGEVEGALLTLAGRLSAGGTRILVTDNEVQLVSAPEAASAIERLRKEELKRDIGKAGAETLAIIAYRGPITRSEIDYIRGVNSTFILRNLQIRGLVERIPHPSLSRSFQYQATPALFAHLGVTHREALPNYTKMMDALDAYEKEIPRVAAAEDAKTTDTPMV